MWMKGHVADAAGQGPEATARAGRIRRKGALPAKLEARWQYGAMLGINFRWGDRQRLVNPAHPEPERWGADALVCVHDGPERGGARWTPGVGGGSPAGGRAEPTAGGTVGAGRTSSSSVRLQCHERVMAELMKTAAGQARIGKGEERRAPTARGQAELEGRAPARPMRPPKEMPGR